MTDATTPPYEQWTARELRDELRARGLPASGNQPELAARLTEADRQPADLTVPELKDELRARDQPVSGNKDELVERLEAADSDEPAPKDRRGGCVVDDGTAHMGRATPGAKICSAHAMHYKADGTPRAEYVTAGAVKAGDVKAEDVKRDE